LLSAEADSKPKLLPQPFPIGNMHAQHFLEPAQKPVRHGGVVPLALHLCHKPPLTEYVALGLLNVTLSGRKMIFKHCSVHGRTQSQRKWQARLGSSGRVCTSRAMAALAHNTACEVGRRWAVSFDGPTGNPSQRSTPRTTLGCSVWNRIQAAHCRRECHGGFTRNDSGFDSQSK
jgi:hypothetical protein